MYLDSHLQYYAQVRMYIYLDAGSNHTLTTTVLVPKAAGARFATASLLAWLCLGASGILLGKNCSDAR